MSVMNRGFASMSQDRRREISGLGGRAAHVKGTAHEWTKEEAREAGRKGGMASHRRRLQPELNEEALGEFGTVAFETIPVVYDDRAILDVAPPHRGSPEEDYLGEHHLTSDGQTGPGRA